MQPIIGKIEQLTHTPPQGGSGVPNKPCFDLSKLDEAQQKADKLKATLLEVQELIRRTKLTGTDIEDRIIGNITDAVKAATTYRTTSLKEHET